MQQPASFVEGGVDIGVMWTFAGRENTRLSGELFPGLLGWTGRSVAISCRGTGPGEMALPVLSDAYLMRSVGLQESDRGFDIIAGGESVGSITFDTRDDGGYIQRVYVDPAYRENGYAKAAVGRLAERFDGKLTSAPTASRAMEAILRRHGFEFRRGEDRPERCEADIWVREPV